MTKLHLVTDSGSQCDTHIDSLYDVSQALRFMAEKADQDDRGGEKFLLNSMAQTVFEAAGSFDELQGETKRLAK